MAITTSRRDSRTVVCFSSATSRGGAQTKLSKGGSLFNMGGTGQESLKGTRVCGKTQPSCPEIQGGKMNRIKLLLIDWLAKDDPKRLIRLIIKRHLEGYHISSNPIRKTKHTEGQCVI